MDFSGWTAVSGRERLAFSKFVVCCFFFCKVLIVLLDGRAGLSRTCCFAAIYVLKALDRSRNCLTRFCSLQQEGKQMTLGLDSISAGMRTIKFGLRVGVKG